MKKVIRLTERDLSHIVKTIITEMESDDFQSRFESMVDEVGEQVISDIYWGELTDDDMDGFASNVSERLTDMLQEQIPNLSVDYTIYHGGTLEFTVYDSAEEETVAEYRPNM
jgi:hypothetical protein